MADPLIQKVYDSLTPKEQLNINKMSIANKYLTLKKMLDKKVDETQFALSPTTPPVPELSSTLTNKPVKVPRTPPDTQLEKEELTTKFVPRTPEDTQPLKIDIPEELLHEDTDEEEEESSKKLAPQGESQKRLDNLINLYYSASPFVYTPGSNHELEVRFGTKGIKPLTRNDYDNVIKKLKSFGFNLIGETTGQYYLRVNCEYLDSVTGKFKISDIRTEISGIHNIQNYCKNNDIRTIYKENPINIKFIQKKMATIHKDRIFPIDFDDFNFRVSYQTEIDVKSGIQNFILSN
jgi:hypothetical protein